MTAEEIQQRMAALRRSISYDVEQIRDSSETMLDWRYYFKRYPWPMIGAAAAVGYLVVPKRVEVVRPAPEDLIKLAKTRQFVIQENPNATPQKGFGGILLGLVANGLMRAATTYVGHQAGKVFTGQPNNTNGRPHVPAK